MLVIERREGERILIDGTIWVSVRQKRTGRFSIGVDAPKCIPVLREELVDPEEGAPKAA